MTKGKVVTYRTTFGKSSDFGYRVPPPPPRYSAPAVRNSAGYPVNPKYLSNARIVGLSPLGRWTISGLAALGAAYSAYQFAGIIGDMPFFKSETSVDPHALQVGDTLGEWTVESVQDLPETAAASTQSFFYPMTKGDGIAYSPSAATTNAHYNLTTQAAAETKYDQWTATPYLSSRAGAYIVRATEKRVTATGNFNIPYDYFFGSTASLSRPVPGTEPLTLTTTASRVLFPVPLTTPRGRYRRHTQTEPVRLIPPTANVDLLTGEVVPGGRDGGRKAIGRGAFILAALARVMGEGLEWLEVIARGFGWTGKRHYRFMFAKGNPNRYQSMLLYLQRGDLTWDWGKFLDAMNSKVLEDKIGGKIFRQTVRDLNTLGVDVPYKFTGLLS